MRQGGIKRGFWVWTLRLLVVACVGAVAFLSPLSAYEKTTDTATVSKFHVAMSLKADGTLISRETIDVITPYGKHGIFRIFDLKDPRRRGIDHPVTGVSVTRDGNPEPWTWEKESKRSRTAKIGSASVLLDPGTHRYVIDSRTTDALEPGVNGDVLWWWDVVGSGWQMSMNSASVTARLPARPSKVECVMGENDPCKATVDGRTLKVAVGQLAPHTPVTVRATFPAGALPTPPGGNSWLEAFAGAIFTSLLAALLGLYLISATRERQPGYPVLFEPPAGVGPALAARVLLETNAKDDMQATLYDLAERGVIVLEGEKKSWRINAVQDSETATITGTERTVLSNLGLHNAGDSFLISDSKTAGHKVSTAISSLQAGVGLEAATYLKNTRAGIASKVLGALALLGTAAMAGTYLFGDMYWPWWLLAPLATFAFVTVGLLLDPATTAKHTPEGVDLWSRTGGFARFLTTDSSESRFEAAQHLDWYPRYLPWAVVFGSAAAWAKRYESQGVELPVVPWMLYTGSDNQMAFASLGNSLSTAISDAVSTYEASQSSSGGGGFSGGSGGGGGGGGSW